MSDTYIPGQCNIGKAEVKRRMRNGYIGLAIAAMCLLLVEIMNWPRALRWLVFPGLFYGISGFIQARQSFCYLYGLFGVFSITGRKHIQRVGAENVSKDRNKAIRTILLIVLLSLVFTLLYVVI